MAVSELCSLDVDLTQLRPFPRKIGKLGPYYRADFDVGVSFGPEIRYGLMRDGIVLGSIVAKYF